MIEPNDFVTEMQKHWVNKLGNVSSENLRRVWRQIASTFSSHISEHNTADRGQLWKILQPPTGSGKSQGTIVYCSMLSELPKEEHPGVLIVTRLKSEASDMAKAINDLSGKEVAVAYHTDTKHELSLHDLSNWPVVIVTHRAYEIALDVMGRDGSIAQNWEYFHDWNHAWESYTRKLVIIDEALDIVEHAQIDLDGLRQTLATIPESLRLKHSDDVKVIMDVIHALEDFEESASKESCKEIMSIEGILKDGEAPDLTAIRNIIKTDIRFDHQIGKDDRDELRRLRNRHDARLKSLQTLLKTWAYYARVEARHSFNTARLLVPEDVKGAVVLDATASSNVLYEVFPYAEVITPPDGARTYENVTLHVSTGHSVGKRTMVKNAKSITSDIVADLNVRLKGHKTFVCCHKDVEPFLAAYDPSFELKTGHWGAVDGSNEWQECDSAVIMGLPYLPDTWASNVFMATQGAQSTKWLQADERPFGKHEDIRKALKVGQMTVSIVQSINRVRCRRVIDEYGNCPKTDIYIMLPEGDMAKSLLDGIRREMPNINILHDWDIKTAKRRVKKSKYAESLVKYLSTMELGKKSATEVRKTLGIPIATFKRLIGYLKDITNELHERLKQTGVEYVVQGSGQIQRAYFVRGH